MYVCCRRRRRRHRSKLPVVTANLRSLSSHRLCGSSKTEQRSIQRFQFEQNEIYEK